MAAEPETAPVEEAGTIKKALNDTVENLQSRFKDVEKVVGETFDKVDERIHMRELVKKVEADAKKRFEEIKTRLKIDELLDKIKETELFGQSKKLSEDAIETLGLITKEQLTAVSDELTKLEKKLESIRRKVGGLPTKKDLNDLVKRVTKLEKAK